MNKFTAFLFSVLIITFFSCRKKEHIEYNDKSDFQNPHCYNEKMDTNELGTDCGLDCKPCEQIYPPCTLPKDTLRVFNTFDVINIKIDSTSIVESTDYTTYYAYGLDNYGYPVFLEIKMKSKPDISKKYFGKTTDNCSSEIGSTCVYIAFHRYGANKRTGTGDVYINYDNGHYIFSSCDYDFSELNSQAGFNQRFNITF